MIRLIKTENGMLWTNYPNLSLIKQLTSRKSQFDYNSVYEKKNLVVRRQINSPSDHPTIPEYKKQCEIE